MYVVFVAGGIASGKSTVARELERLGATRIDLDQVSRDVLAPGSATLRAITDAFGTDLVDPATGMLDRRTLAERAFATREGAARLESIELPAIRDRLSEALACVRAAADAGDTHATTDALCIVEVPLLDKVGEAIGLADEVVAVCCPTDVRVERAVRRGMGADDVYRRMANQPTDAWLCAHANTVIHNAGTTDDLLEQVHAWWRARRTVGTDSTAAEETHHVA